MRIKIIAPLPSISKRTRLQKITDTLSKMKVDDILYFGWQRDEVDYIENGSRIILKGGGYSSKSARLMYPLWMIKVFITSFNFDKRDTVWALGLESAFPAVLVSKLKGFKVIYDDADRFSSLFNFPNPIKKALIKLEIYTSFNCLKHVIPGKDRYEFSSPNFYIMKNTPTTTNISRSKEVIFEPKLINSLTNYHTVIYINGWLGETRGMKTIYEVAKALPEFGFILAGRIDSEYANKIISLKNAYYLGELHQYEALAYYQISDFVYTYYDPNIPINLKAESNKWGDALQFQVPVIVNSEVITARYLIESKSAISSKYSDHRELILQLVNSKKGSSNYKSLKTAVSNLQNKYPTFEKQVKKLFNEFNS